MFGKIIIDILFILSIIGSISYFVANKRGKEYYLKIGRYSYYTIFFGIIFVSAYFLNLIFSHNFQYTYIWSYSSKQLPTHLLISTFYAGQEGSFLLWTLFVSLVGFILLPYSKRNNYEPLSMGFYTLILSFLFLILIVKSPFSYIWETFPEVELGFMPSNGRGLNPILENPWIVIHPPILFAGYAMMTVPYVFALSALIKKDYKGWINVSTPWIIISSGILGLGIGLGGFWAYETLGWGGFWGWDPVENSSLLPWLISIALVHTILVQKTTGGLVKTNFLLAITSFIFVLYATFLTRSGILGDISVHSFVDPGTFVYTILLVFIFLFLIIGLYFLILRFKEVEKTKINFSFVSREGIITLGALLLLLSTLIVFIGTSMPIFLEIIGQPKTAVETTFYDKWNLPITFLFMILCGFSFYLNWRTNKINTFGKIILPFIVSAIVVIAFYFSGINELKHLILSYASIYCLYNSLLYGIPLIKKNIKLTGSYISHAGVGLFFIGVVFSGGYDSSRSLELYKGETGEAFGYKFTFVSADRVEVEKPDREKYKCVVKIQRKDDIYFVSPVVYWSDFNQRQAPFFEPGIAGFISKDLYISPKHLSYENDMPSIVLTKGKTAKIPYDSTWNIKLIGFDMNANQASGNRFKFGSIVEYFNQTETLLDTLYLTLDMSGSGQSTPIWEKFKNSKISIGFTNFQLNQEKMADSQVLISFAKEGETIGGRELFVFEITTKPLILFVWIGSIAIYLGFFISLLKYLKKE